jgi:hypothetical protein
MAFGKPSSHRIRWLRKIFYDDWSLKLLALAITLLLWFFIAGRETEIEREVPVEPLIAGTPAAGFELKNVTVTPKKVRVKGPEDQLRATSKVMTQIISIDGRTSSVDLFDTHIDTLDPDIDALDTVTVHVEIVPFPPAKLQNQETN